MSKQMMNKSRSVKKIEEEEEEDEDDYIFNIYKNEDKLTSAKPEKHLYDKMLSKLQKNESKRQAHFPKKNFQAEDNNTSLPTLNDNKKKNVTKGKRGRKPNNINSYRNNSLHEKLGTYDSWEIDDNQIDQSSYKKTKINEPISAPALLQKLIHSNYPFVFNANPSSVAKNYFNHEEHSKMATKVEGLRDITNKKKNQIPYDEIKPLIKLWDYQEDTLNFIVNRENDVANIGCNGVMLCHDMGLGKTPTSLTHILRRNQFKFKRTRKRFNERSLVICNNILVNTWKTEIEKSFPEDTFIYYDLTDPQQLDNINQVLIEECCDIVFITYSMLSTTYKIMKQRESIILDQTNPEEEEEEDEEEKEYDDEEDEAERNIGLIRRQKTIEKHEKLKLLYKVKWTRVLTDESQKFVNKKTKLFTAVNSLDALSKWIITGTPIQNSLDNIYACFMFIGVDESKYMIHPNEIDDIHKDNGDDDDQEKTNFIINERIKGILSIVMTRLVKGDSLLKKNNVLTSKGVDRQIIYLDFETIQEKLVYLLYASYGLRNLQQMRNKSLFNSNKSSSSSMKQKTGKDYHNKVTYIIQLMRQLSINFRIVKNLVLPRGMLTMNLTPELMLKNTGHNESLFNDEEEEEDIEKQKVIFQPKTVDKVVEIDDLKEFSNTMDKCTTFEYNNILTTKTHIRSGDEDDSAIIWDPYTSIQYFTPQDKEAYRMIYNALSSLPSSTCTTKEKTHIIDKVIQQQIYRHHDKVINTNDLKERLSSMIEHINSRRLSCASTKDIHIINYIKNIQDPTDKVIIFSDYVKALTCLATELSKEGFKYAIVTCDRVKNSSNIDQLKLFRDDPTVKVLLLSLKLGNNGLNLSCANHIIFYSKWWNPHIEFQAEDRSIRIGQNKIVYVRYFIINGTIEEYILKLSNAKKKISETLIKPANTMTTVTEEDELLVNTNAEVKHINKFKEQLFDFNITVKRTIS
jgi:SNF2 family DNA or RNA helicase